MNNIYQEKILQHYKNPKNFGLLNFSSVRVKVSNVLCGDKIEMGLKLSGKIIKDIKFKGEGCVISIATASMLTEYVKGKKIEELKKIDKNFIINLLGVNLGPSRLKCALLPLEALHKLLFVYNFKKYGKSKT